MRELAVALLAGLSMASAGCGWTKKDGAGQPFLRGRNAIAGNPIRCEPVEAWERPVPPEAPEGNR